MKITSDTIWYAVRPPLGTAISKKVRGDVWGELENAVHDALGDSVGEEAIEVVSGVIEEEVLP